MATVVTQQPQLGANQGYDKLTEWMQRPLENNISGLCPSGLENLAVLNELYVKQRRNLTEAFSRCNPNLGFDVMNPTGQKVFNAVEDTPCWLHWCLKNSRDFRLNLFDSYDNTVLRVMRQKKWAPPRMDDVNIFGPSDDLLGKVQQEFDCWLPKLDIKDKNGSVIYKIIGPWNHCNGCGDLSFKIYRPDDLSIEVGSINRSRATSFVNFLADIDHYRMNFPADCNVQMKAVLLGALFTIWQETIGDAYLTDTPPCFPFIEPNNTYLCFPKEASQAYQASFDNISYCRATTKQNG